MRVLYTQYPTSVGRVHWRGPATQTRQGVRKGRAARVLASTEAQQQPPPAVRAPLRSVRRMRAGEVALQEDAANRIACLVRSVPPKLTFTSAVQSRTPFMIGVAGGTASGKTSVVKLVLEGLRGDDSMQELWPESSVASIVMDKFYRDLTPEEQLNVGDVNFDHPSAFDMEKLYECLHDLKQGKSVEVPRYDFVTSARLPETDRVEGAQVVIFEGILALYVPEILDLLDMKIFVDTDSDTRLARRIRRDIAERGRSVESVLSQYEKTVKPSFEQYVLPTKRNADIIVPHGAQNTVAIELITQHLRDLLNRKALAGGASVDRL